MKLGWLVLAVALLAGCEETVGAEPDSGSGVYLEGHPCLTSVDESGKIFARCFLPGMKGDLIVDVFTNHCLAKMEDVLRQLEMELSTMEQQYVTVPLWELRAMLQRNPTWNETKRDCWGKP